MTVFVEVIYKEIPGKPLKTLQMEVAKLFTMTEHMPNLLEKFHLPFGGKLNSKNRWVQLALIIPWDRVEAKYMDAFQSPVRGQIAYSVRVALGSLIIKERMGLSDRETTLQIMENPYLQYFIGNASYVDQEPFHHSLMTHFRERLGVDILSEVNEWISIEAAKAEIESVSEAKKKASKRDDNDDSNPGQLSMDVGDTLSIPEGVPSPMKKAGRPKTLKVWAPSCAICTNRGTLILDATCAPADIKYPTDLGLLNHGREILEDIIDTLHTPHIGQMEKPRTYREQARKEFLNVSKQRRPSAKTIRKAIKKQLSYVSRDLKTIESLVEHTPLTALSRKQYRNLLVIQELVNQQKAMYDNKTHSVADRIVSIEQPHVRPIVRGKAGAAVEFGAKIAASVVGGYTFIEKLQWDNFNEATTLKASVETHKQRFGYYPSVILADKIYRTRENLSFCKELGIRLSGPKLGRPSKEGQAGDKRQERHDAAQRNAIEGKFGEGKRKFGLGLIRARLSHTSQTVIALQFLVMNLERRLRVLFFLIFRLLGFRALRWV